MEQNTIYLDNNATTQVDPEVVEAIIPFLHGNYFNPSSAYSQADITKTAIEKSRKIVANFIGATLPTEIIFTGSASESNNTAIFGTISANPTRKHIITTSVEHPSVYEVCKHLERNGFEVTYLKVDGSGQIAYRDLIRAIRPDTALVSIMHANNETGVIFPIDKLSKIVKKTDEEILFHTDATQSAGKIPINLKHDFMYVDMLSFSGHKLHAPKGVGSLFIRKGSRCRPLLVGGHQEKGRRAGTENVAYIVGLAKAVSIAENSMKEDHSKIKSLRDKLETHIVKDIPSAYINGRTSQRLPTTTSISFESIEGESILYALNEKGICASTGSACSSGSLAPSHVLRAMNIPFTAAHGTIRFSFSRFNDEKDVDVVLRELPGVIESLRNLSPYWDKEKNLPKNQMANE